MRVVLQYDIEVPEHQIEWLKDNDFGDQVFDMYRLLVSQYEMGDYKPICLTENAEGKVEWESYAYFDFETSELIVIRDWSVTPHPMMVVDIPPKQQP